MYIHMCRDENKGKQVFEDANADLLDTSWARDISGWQSSPWGIWREKHKCHEPTFVSNNQWKSYWWLQSLVLVKSQQRSAYHIWWLYSAWNIMFIEVHHLLMFESPLLASLGHLIHPNPNFFQGSSLGGRRSFLQLRDSSGLSAQQPPYSFAVRYDLRPLSKQPLGSPGGKTWRTKRHMKGFRDTISLS